MRLLRLLGPVGINQAGATENGEEHLNRSPRFRSRRTVAILGYLAVERRSIAREHLAALFWPDEASGKGRTNLRRELHNLAQVLPGSWKVDRQSVEFLPSAETKVDIDTLLELEVEKRWQAATELLAGEFLEGLHLSDNARFESWLLAERERWRARSEHVLTQACDEFTKRGHHSDALLYGRRLLQAAPWNEDAHRNVMRLLAWTGQREAALRQFEFCVRSLEEELAVEPSNSTIELHRKIQAGGLPIPPSPPGFVLESLTQEVGHRPVFVARQRELARLDEYLEVALAGQSRVVFVTGEAGTGKTALMDAFARRALKSHSDLLIAKGKCDAHSGAGDAYSPFRDAMSMLTGDVEARWSAGTISGEHARRMWKALPIVIQALLDHGPQLLNVIVQGPALLRRAARAEPTGAPWLDELQELVNRQQAETADSEKTQIDEQFTNVLRTIAGQQPLLLLIDDLQWVDAASLEFLFHAGRRLADVSGRILIVCAYRPTEIVGDLRARGSLLRRVLNEFKRRFGDVWMSLSWADEYEARQFVDALVDAEPNRLSEDFRAVLLQRTAAHPLFTVELLRALHERGDLVADSKGYLQVEHDLDWEVLPARVEAVIEERLQQLEPELLEMLTTASVEGELFTAQVLAQVRGMEEGSVLRQLSQDLESRYRLVQEQEESQTGRGNIVRYRFGHALFQAHLYSRLGRGERRLLHSAVAGALEKLYAGDLDTMAVQLARHYDQAGDETNALRYFAMAADHAAKVYAHDEAIGHYTRAIDTAQSLPSDAVLKAGLYRGRGLAHSTSGHFDQANADFETALRFADSAEEPRIKWQSLIDLGRLWASRDYGRALGYFEDAVETARGMDDPAALANSLNWMGNWYANNEEPSKALERHREALQIFHEMDDPANLANTLDLVGVANILEGDYQASVANYSQAITLFRELNNQPRLAASLLGRAATANASTFLAVLPAADAPDPIADFEEAVQISQKIGSLADELWSMAELTILSARHGEFGEALESGQRGLRLASAIEHREWTVGNRYALGVVYSEVLAPEEAREELEQGFALAQELRSQYWINHVAAALTKAYMMRGELSEAQSCIDTVIDGKTRMDTTGKRYCWARRAELALVRGETTTALDITERLLSSAAGMEPGRVITFLSLLKAGAFAALGRTEEAISLLYAAIENAGRSEEQFLLWRLHGRLAQLYAAIDQAEKGERELLSARKVIKKMTTTIPDKALRNNFRLRAGEALQIPNSRYFFQ